MFCGECGAKNPDSSKFCEECGAKLEENGEKKETKENLQKEESTTTKTIEKMKLSKKQKMIGCVILIIVAILISIYKILENQTKPVTIIKELMQSIEEKDYDKLYDFANFSGDTTFIPKEQFKKVLDESLKDFEIENYNISNQVIFEESGLTAKVPVAIIMKGDSYDEETVEIPVTKLRDKKYLFFDNWQVSEIASFFNNSIILKDYVIHVPKNSKIFLNGIEVDAKYIDKEKNAENNSIDSYKLPQIFDYETTIKVELPYGINVEDKWEPSSYREYTLHISDENISEEIKNKLTEAVKNNTTLILNALAENKNFDDIKGNFATGEKLEDIQSNYEKELSYAKNSNYTSKDCKLTDLKVSTISFNSEFKIKVPVTAKYTWTKTNKDTGKAEEANRSESFTMLFVYEDGFKLCDLNQAPSLYDYNYWW